AASRSSSTARKAASARKGGGAPEAGYRIAELYIERRGGRSIVGNIYKGKVDNVVPGLEAAFVDIGLEKNGFLHVDEIVLPGVEAPKRGRGGSGRKITDLLSPGQEIVVQVVKDPLKTKGARLSIELTIAPGLVFQEADLSVRVVRDIFSAHFERAVVDDEKQYHRLVSFFTRTAPELVERVELWQKEQPLFEAYGVDKAIDGVLSRR